MTTTGTSLPNDASEEALVAALARGERDAADALVDRTYAAVFRFLCQLCHGDAARAADLTQESYRRAWASLDRFEGRAAFTTWLCRIGYHAFLDETRRAANRETDDDDERVARLPDRGEPIDVLLARDEEHAALRRAVLALPDDLRFTVVARYWADASTADIAQLLGISDVAIRKRLRRAMDLLARALEDGR